MEFLSEIPIALWIAGFLALYMAWAIGANDVANAMGTSVGSGALTVWGAIMVAAILEFAGAFLAGGHVTDTVRKGMLDLSMMSREQLIYGMLGSLAAAGTLLVVATRFGLPISTTHSIVGAIVGFGAIAIGLDAVKWGKIAQIVLSWVTSPLLAGVIAFFIFQITRLKVLDKPDPIVQIRKLGPVFFFFVFFIIGLVTLSVAYWIGCVWPYRCCSRRFFYSSSRCWGRRSEASVQSCRAYFCGATDSHCMRHCLCAWFK